MKNKAIIAVFTVVVSFVSVSVTNTPNYEQNRVGFYANHPTGHCWEQNGIHFNQNLNNGHYQLSAEQQWQLRSQKKKQAKQAQRQCVLKAAKLREHQEGARE